ncbi:MAG TPA: LytTR family DNA-binding domain-containing protein, partial [Rhizomicrobium sp.]|nr:LytTR family DNA-binding domain-containing protein [Rhizomicrobium sp.]
ITILHDRPELRPIVPIIGEITSLVMLLSLLWIPWFAWRQPGPLRPRTLLGHAAALVIFSAAHVTGFTLLRKIIYWTIGQHYGGDFPGDYIYEFPRDAIAYGLAMLAFSMAGQRLEARAAPSGGRTLFDIRDGTRLLRVPFDDILAVSSAGNYVEFVLRDGRKPLMRSPLSALETELAQHGFVRVHRSWLVNAMQMTGLKPEGSGDYTVELGEVTVPLSRRYPEALAKLRAA